MRRLHVEKRGVFAFLLLALLAMTTCLLLPESLQAAEGYSASETGNITVTLDDVADSDGNVTDKEGVTVALYRVGTVTGEEQPTFTLTEDFSDVDVDFSAVTTAAANKEAAAKFVEVIEEDEIDQIAGAKTDAEGNVTFSDLAQGAYLIAETDGADYGVFSPFLVFIPYAVDGEDWTYDVTTKTKGQEATTESTATTTSAKKTTGAGSGGGKSTSSRGGKTGDNSQLGLWGIVAVAAVLVIAFIVARRHKKEN